MFQLDVSRKELESRILAIIEDFNGNPLAKKQRRLSIINQSLRTLIYGSDAQSAGKKNNEHNLDAFFADSKHQPTEQVEKTTYTLIESYRHESSEEVDPFFRSTHDSMEAALHHLYVTVIESNQASLHTMMLQEDVESVISHLSDEELDTLKDELFYGDITEVMNESENGLEFAENIVSLNNVGAMKRLFEIITSNSSIKGDHRIIEETEFCQKPQEQPKQKYVHTISIVADFGSLGVKNYLSAVDPSGAVKEFLRDVAIQTDDEYRRLKPDHSESMLVGEMVMDKTTKINRLIASPLLSPETRSQLELKTNASWDEVIDTLVESEPLANLISDKFINVLKHKTKPFVKILSLTTKTEEL